MKAGIIEVETVAFVVRWVPAGSLQGSEGALRRLRSPLLGSFGMMPGQVLFDQALTITLARAAS